MKPKFCKNVISRKFERLRFSYLAADFATPGTTLAALQLRVVNFKFSEIRNTL